jgi:hypothetical protein
MNRLYDYAVILIFISVMMASMWMCRHLLFDGREFFKQSKTKILQAESKEAAAVNAELHRMLDGIKSSELNSSGKLSLGNAPEPCKKEMCRLFDALSGHPFKVNTVVSSRGTKVYMVFCEFSSLGDYRIDVAKTDNGFAIVGVESIN